MTSGAASLPVPGDDRAGRDLPGPEALRIALHPAELPLARPRDVAQAAARVSDLISAGRLQEARRLAAEFRRRTALPADRAALLRAALRGALRSGDAAQAESDSADLVSLLHRSGRTEQAAAVVQVLLERGPLAEAPDRTGTGGRGRRRGEALRASAPMLAVVRALEASSLPGPDGGRGGTVDPRRAVARFRAALAALPEVREALLEDPERELRLRLAQALEAVGDVDGAVSLALDVLELTAQQATERGEAPADPWRLETGAHALLARLLRQERPVVAAHHALEALGGLADVDDPPLRIGLITSLLQALMAAGATDLAGFTAGRLLSLQRTLEQDRLRIAPLLAVTAQRLQAERLDAAWVPLEQARALAREHRDHRSLLEAARLAASLHERAGDHAASLGELQRLAAAARWLVDDLDTPREERSERLRTELSANALAMRRALDLGRSGAVHVAAREIERRTRPDSGWDLPPELLWDHLVDARMGVLIVAGDALARGEQGTDQAGYEARRREVLEAIGQMPEGHDARARYWAAYLDDRHADLLARRGETAAARRAARRARSAYEALGRDEDAARVARLVTELEAAREAEGGAERTGHGAGHGAGRAADVRSGRDFEDDGDERAESA